MCCKSFWKRIIAFTLGVLIGVFATGLLHEIMQETSLLKGENDDIGGVSLTYRTTTYPLRIISMPEPGYTDAARQNQTVGVVRLRVMFLASGQIGKVTPVEGLPYGLTEKAIEAALNIEFKPLIVFGEPITATKIVEYRFSIY